MHYLIIIYHIIFILGTTAVVALIHSDKLYVANVGNSRALLCRTDSDGFLRVVQLSVDHDLSNEDEILRLYKLGLSTDKIRQGTVGVFLIGTVGKTSKVCYVLLFSPLSHSYIGVI